MTMHGDAVPNFYLYGEPHQRVYEDFVHVESLDDRSRPSEWTIRPHSHDELNHIFLVATGGGSMRVEDAAIAFDAPALLLVPAGVAHGFAWERESTGSVLTLAAQHLRGLEQRDGALTALFVRPRTIALNDAECGEARLVMADLARELGWSVAGHKAAVEAALLRLLVLALRRTEGDGAMAASTRPGPQAALVARYRARIEQRFRLREPVSEHARALGTSETALRAACARVARTSPAAMLDARALLEARRALIYSNLSVAAIGYALGFADATYFSRFFARHLGSPPGRYRASRLVS